MTVGSTPTALSPSDWSAALDSVRPPANNVGPSLRLTILAMLERLLGLASKVPSYCQAVLTPD